MIVANVMQFKRSKKSLTVGDREKLERLFGRRAIELAKSIPKISFEGSKDWLQSDSVSILCKKVGVKPIALFQIAYN